jgi:hypothetical protein
MLDRWVTSLKIAHGSGSPRVWMPASHERARRHFPLVVVDAIDDASMDALSIESFMISRANGVADPACFT